MTTTQVQPSPQASSPAQPVLAPAVPSPALDPYFTEAHSSLARFSKILALYAPGVSLWPSTVMALYCQVVLGLTAKQAADRLGNSRRTIDYHLDLAGQRLDKSVPDIRADLTRMYCVEVGREIERLAHQGKNVSTVGANG